jgi:hypothetical protein
MRTSASVLDARRDILTECATFSYAMAAWASMGGMYFGWDVSFVSIKRATHIQLISSPATQSGLIGGILSEKAFQLSFGLDKAESAQALAALKGNIVSVLQAGEFSPYCKLAFGWGGKDSADCSMRNLQDASLVLLRRSICRIALGDVTRSYLQHSFSLSGQSFRYVSTFSHI